MKRVLGKVTERGDGQSGMVNEARDLWKCQNAKDGKACSPPLCTMQNIKLTLLSRSKVTMKKT